MNQQNASLKRDHIFKKIDFEWIFETLTLILDDEIKFLHCLYFINSNLITCTAHNSFNIITRCVPALSLVN